MKTIVLTFALFSSFYALADSEKTNDKVSLKTKKEKIKELKETISYSNLVDKLEPRVPITAHKNSLSLIAQKKESVRPIELSPYLTDSRMHAMIDGDRGGNAAVVEMMDGSFQFLDLFTTALPEQEIAKWPASPEVFSLDEKRFLKLAHFVPKSFANDYFVKSELSEMLKSIPSESQLAKLIDISLSNMSFRFVDAYIQDTNTFYAPSEFLIKNTEIKSIRTLAWYGTVRSKELGLVTISLPLWNKLSKKVQAAVIIHEALKHIQLLYSFDIKTSELQELVANIYYSREQLVLETYNRLSMNLDEVVEKANSDNSCYSTYNSMVLKVSLYLDGRITNEDEIKSIRAFLISNRALFEESTHRGYLTPFKSRYPLL